MGPKVRQGKYNMTKTKTIANLADYMYPKLRRQQKKKRPQNPKELIEQAIAKDDPELIPEMYDDNDGSDELRDAKYDWDMMADRERKYNAERWDR